MKLIKFLLFILILYAAVLYFDNATRLSDAVSYCLRPRAFIDRNNGKPFFVPDDLHVFTPAELRGALEQKPYYDVQLLAGDEPFYRYVRAHHTLSQYPPDPNHRLLGHAGNAKVWLALSSPDASQIIKLIKNGHFGVEELFLIYAFVNGCCENSSDSPPAGIIDGINIGLAVSYAYHKQIANLNTWLAWVTAGLDPRDGIGAELAKIYPSWKDLFERDKLDRLLKTYRTNPDLAARFPAGDYKPPTVIPGPGSRAVEQDINFKNFIRNLSENPELLKVFLTLASAHHSINFQQYLWRKNYPTAISNIGNDYDFLETPSGILLQIRADLFSRGMLTQEGYEKYLRQDIEIRAIREVLILPYHLSLSKMRPSTTPESIAQQLVESHETFFKHYTSQAEKYEGITQWTPAWQEWYMPWLVNMVYESLSIAKAQGVSYCDEIWAAFRKKVVENQRKLIEAGPTQAVPMPMPASSLIIESAV